MILLLVLCRLGSVVSGQVRSGLGRVDRGLKGLLFPLFLCRVSLCSVVRPSRVRGKDGPQLDQSSVTHRQGGRRQNSREQAKFAQDDERRLVMM